MARRSKPPAPLVAQPTPSGVRWIEDEKRRPLELKWATADTIDDHPENWRTHPHEQTSTLAEMIGLGSKREGFPDPDNPAQVGWAGACLFNRRTNRFLDGHARKNLGFGEIPVLVGDWTEEQERLILATLDPLAEAARPDPRKQLEILQRVQSSASNLLLARNPSTQDMLSGLQSGAAAILEKLGKKQFKPTDDAEDTLREGAEDVSDIIFAFREDAIFSSSNEWGIPDLLPDMLSEQVPTEVYVKGKQVDDAARFMFMADQNHTAEVAAGGVLAFYVHDEHFERFWRDAVFMLGEMQEIGWGSVLMPDFSLWHKDPLAIQLYNTYRNFWCARYWQEAGIKIIPSLTHSMRNTWAWAWIGVPRGCPVVSAQCRTANSRSQETRNAARTVWLAAMNEALDRIRPRTCLLYGGKQNREWLEPYLPDHVEYVWLSSQREERNWGVRRRDKKKKQ